MKNKIQISTEITETHTQKNTLADLVKIAENRVCTEKKKTQRYRSHNR